MSIQRILQLTDELQHKLYVDNEELRDKSLELEKLALESNAVYALACAQVSLATYYLSYGMYNECREYVTLGIATSEEENFEDLLLRGYNTFALLCKSLFDDNMALEYFLKAIQLAEKTENVESLSKLTNNLGDMFLQLKDYDTAFPYFVESYEYTQKMSDSIGKFFTMSIALLNMADVEFHIGKYQEAYDHVLECQDLFTKFDASELVDYIQCCKAVSCYHLGKEEETNACISKLIEQLDYEVKEDIENSFNMYCMVIDLLIKMNDEERCRLFVNKLIELAELLKMPLYKMIAQEWNIRYRKALKNGEGLNECYEHYFIYAMENKVGNYQNRSKSMKVKLDLINAIFEKERIAKENAELEELSIIDELTGIPNRRSFNKEMTKIAKAGNTNEMVAAIIVDVDYFKQYNDYYGHLAGDEVLRTVANCLKSDDERFYPTRFGGDEFIVIVRNATNAEVANYIETLYQRIHDCNIKHIASPIHDRITISTGYYLEKIENFSVKNLVEKADDALYRAKENGKNQFLSA